MEFLTATCRIGFDTPLGRVDAFPFEPVACHPPIKEAAIQQGLHPFMEFSSDPQLYKKKYVPGILKPGSKVLVSRFGGIGDVLWITPVCRGLKEQIPGLHIKFMCFSKDREAMYNNPFVDEVITSNRPTVDDCMSVDAVLDFYETVEGCQEANYLHPIDYSCKLAGVNPSSRLPVWIINDMEKEWVDTFLATEGAKPGEELIGFAIGASSPHRTWVYWDELATLILATYPNAKIVLTGNMQHAFDGMQKVMEKHKDSKRVINAFGGTTLRQLVALLARCSLTVSCDTGMVHALGGLLKPVLGIFSTVPAVSRVSLYPTVHAIQADVPCAPCFKIGEPCEYGDRCMTTLSAGKVFQRFREVCDGLKS